MSPILRLVVIIIIFVCSYILAVGFNFTKYAPMKQQQIETKTAFVASVSMFDPFRDIRASSNENGGPGRVSYQAEDEALEVIQPEDRFSSFRCSQSDVLVDKGYEPGASRSCMFHNLYYHRGSKSFHYFSSPEESCARNATAIEEQTTTVAGYLLHEGSKKRIKKTIAATKLTPKVHTNESLPTSLSLIDMPANPVFLLYVISYSFNIGHFVFDDAMSLFTLLDYFGYSEMSRQSYQMIPLPVSIGHEPYFRCQTRMDSCNKMLSKVMPALLGIAFTNDTFLLTTDNLGGVDTSDSEWLLLPTVIVGTGRIAYISCHGDCALHRATQLFRFRRWMFQNLFGEDDGNARADMVATSGIITVALPIGNTHHGVQSFDEIIPALKARFGDENVRAYDMANLTLQEQAEVVSQTKVFLCNSGGGSASSLFLPRGSSLILYHLRDTMNDKSLYDSVPYFHIDWLLCDAPVRATLPLVELGLQAPRFR